MIDAFEEFARRAAAEVTRLEAKLAAVIAAGEPLAEFARMVVCTDPMAEEGDKQIKAALKRWDKATDK